MGIKKTTYTLLIMLTLLVFGCKNKNDKDIVKIKDFYTSYLNIAEKIPYNKKGLDSLKAQYFTKDLIKKVEYLKLDYDPILNSNDVDTRWVDNILVKKDSASLNIYQISYTNGSSYIKLKINDAYKIEDIGDISILYDETVVKRKKSQYKNSIVKKWFGKYSYNTTPYKLDSLSSIPIYYEVIIQKDSIFFSGQGYKTNFYDLCYTKQNADTLELYYNKSLEGTDYNKDENGAIAKLFKNDNAFFIISPAIEDGEDKKDIPVLIKREK